ncbi:hypothetical protein [Niallia sp. FSL W8-0635]|uniref:hypothetical protein n=1 Tax=Niallia sp. FSL W8-0635 TaxID=2975337 RepID=UPI0030F94B2E
MMSIDEQLSLFQEFLTKNDIWQANLLIKNIFNKNIENRDVFQTFYEFSIKIANWNLDIPTRKLFLEQAFSAVIFFSENALLTSDVIEMVYACQNEVDNIRNEITRIEQIQIDRRVEDAKKEQSELILKLTEYKFALGKSRNQQEFNTLLEKIKVVEEQIDVSFLTEMDEKLYKELTMDYPNIINQKLNEFEKVKVKEYNKKAVSDFYQVFNEFKQNEDKYKTSMLELKRLVRTRLFSYDAGRLLNETIIYYNHVYSYIFGKLDEEGKYNLTELAIELEKAN